MTDSGNSEVKCGQGYYWLDHERLGRSVGRFDNGVWAIVGKAITLSDADLKTAGFRAGQKIGGW